MAGGGGGGGEVQESGFGKNVFGEASAQSVELNLTALMDILSNLLFFLLASFGATIVMSINATVPVQSSDKSDVADTKQTVTVNVRLGKAALEIDAAGSAQTEAELAPLRRRLPWKGDEPDYAGLTEHLLMIKEKYPKSDTMILTPEAGIAYETMVRTMDAAREREVQAGGGRRMIKVFPTVVISTLVK
jgi:biopolymer transport protein ExbD